MLRLGESQSESQAYGGSPIRSARFGNAASHSRSATDVRVRAVKRPKEPRSEHVCGPSTGLRPTR